MENSNIEWCHHTFNAWEGCDKIGPGCDNCYAATRNHRFHAGANWGPDAPRQLRSDKYWREPLKWNSNHAAFFATHGCRQRVFVNSLADVFDNKAPEGQRERLWQLIRDTPNLDWLLLTKRIGNAAKMLPADWGNGYPNVWLGVTVVNQPEADRDISKLLKLPAHVLFLSIEPMLGAIELTKLPWRFNGFTGESVKTINALTGDVQSLDPVFGAAANGPKIHQVIVGGESGPGARPMHPAWVRLLRDQCASARVPFLFKQWGEWHTIYSLTSTDEAVFHQFHSFQDWVNKARSWVRGGICLDRHGTQLRNGGDFMRARDAGDFPVTIMHRVGKKRAGRLLDGVEHNGYPVVPV
jgi:protein gp37